MGRICYAISAALTLLFAIWFLVIENDSPGLSFAIALIGMPLLLLFFAFSKSTNTGITKDGKGAGWAAFVIALVGVAYIAMFFGDWLIVAVVWLLALVPSLVGNLVSATNEELGSTGG